MCTLEYTVKVYKYVMVYMYISVNIGSEPQFLHYSHCCMFKHANSHALCMRHALIAVRSNMLIHALCMRHAFGLKLTLIHKWQKI